MQRPTATHSPVSASVPASHSRYEGVTPASRGLTIALLAGWGISTVGMALGLLAFAWWRL